MYIKMRKVHIHNFLSFADEEVIFEDMGYTIVTGKNNRKIDNAISNGSGKSTIFNAVCYALTGETAQGLSNNIENVYADPEDCWVELDFSVDDDRFVIRRIKTPRTDLKIYINGIDASGKGIKESTRLLNDYLPDLNSRLIGSIIILGQGLPYRFTNNHPGGRKDILEKLTKSDYMIQSIRDKLDFRMSELKVQLRSYEDAKVANTTQLNMLNKQVSKCELELKDLYNTPFKKLEDIENEVTDVKIKLNEINESIDSLSKEDVDLNNKLTELTHKYYADLDILNKEFNKLNLSTTSSIAELNASIKSLKNEIKKAESMPDICPTCGQIIPEEKKIDTQPLKEKLKSHAFDLDRFNIIKLDNEKLHTDKQIKLKCEYDDSTKEFNKRRSDIVYLRKHYEVSQKDWTTKLNDLYQLELQIKHINENCSKLNDTINKDRDEIKLLEDESAKIDSNILITNEHISIIQNMITLTKREFRGVLLENVIKYINSKCKEYSKYVFDTELLTFELNENYIDIKYDGKYYEALSGGEKQKVDIIIQLAIRDLLSNQLNIHSSLLVCDEIFDNLDNQGCQRIIDLISKIKDIESVFIISHHAAELQISYDNQIEVEKGDDGISTVKIH